MPTPNTAPSYPSTQSTTPKSSRSPILYILLGALIVLLLAAAYFTIFSSGSASVPNRNIESNLTNANLTPVQHLFYADLAKAIGLHSIGVVYSMGNFSNVSSGPTGLALLTTVNQTVSSYKSGNYSVSTSDAVVSYRNLATNELLQQNVSKLYFYSTPQDVVSCLNETTNTGISSNSNFTCTLGDGGLGYLDSFPSTISNLTALGYLGVGKVTYSGNLTILGRSCNSFYISNLTAYGSDNYSTISTCLDSQYGLPLYFNETDYINGVQTQGMLLLLRNITTNVAQSSLAIPAAYLGNAQNASSFI